MQDLVRGFKIGASRFGDTFAALDVKTNQFKVIKNIYPRMIAPKVFESAKTEVYFYLQLLKID